VQEAPDKPAFAWRRWGLRVLKFAVVAAVLLFVSRTFAEAWRELTQRGVSIHLGPALAAGGLIGLSQLPMAWFWRRVLVTLGQPAPPGATLVAYVIGQIGKYVPGKATVVLIRTERLLAAYRRSDDADLPAPSAATIGATVFYETLTHMAVGSLVAAGLAATIPLGDGEWRGGLVALSVVLAAACLTPTLPPVFAWLLGRVTRDRHPEARMRRLSYGLAAQGAVASVTSWCVASGAVWCAARSVGAAGEVGVAGFPAWLLAATLPVIAGFVSLLPAGVLVREALTLTVLSPMLGEGDALATTIALRVIWVATEVLLCGSLLAIGFIGGSRDR